jgi:hypothetical protein
MPELYEGLTRYETKMHIAEDMISDWRHPSRSMKLEYQGIDIDLTPP